MLASYCIWKLTGLEENLAFSEDPPKRVGHFSECLGPRKGFSDESRNRSYDDGIIGTFVCCGDANEGEFILQTGMDSVQLDPDMEWNRNGISKICNILHYLEIWCFGFQKHPRMASFWLDSDVQISRVKTHEK